MQAGIEPMEAYERLKKYKRLYEERERKWRTYSDGEDLFGLPITEYPELVKTQKELEFLDR
jgi:dynein heavy chain